MSVLLLLLVLLDLVDLVDFFLDLVDLQALDAFSFAVVHLADDFFDLLVDFFELSLLLFFLVSDFLESVLEVLFEDFESFLDDVDFSSFKDLALDEVDLSDDLSLLDDFDLSSDSVELDLLETDFLSLFEDFEEVLLFVFDELVLRLEVLVAAFLGADVSPREVDTLDLRPLSVAAPIPVTFIRSSTLEKLPFFLR